LKFHLLFIQKFLLVLCALLLKKGFQFFYLINYNLFIINFLLAEINLVLSASIFRRIFDHIMEILFKPFKFQIELLINFIYYIVVMSNFALCGFRSLC